MITKRKLLIISLGLFTIFILTTRHIFIQLGIIYDSGFTLKKDISVIDEKIYQEVKHLPEYYRRRVPDQDKNYFLTNNLKNGIEIGNISKLWSTANSWVSKDQLYDPRSPELKHVFFALKNSNIIKADLDTRGTQLKLLLTLEGGQQVVFKPKWYDKDKIIEGPVYSGKDRYGSEIVGFYISLLLNKCLAPISVERRISFKYDIIPVATERLLRTSYQRMNRTCIYGKCFYCKKEDAVCEDNNFSITGAVIFNIKATLKNYRSPWQRTYSNERKALWQESDSYCKAVKEKLTAQRIHDLVDVAIFDFLIQNGDRHHYETLNATVLFLDNGKGLGNPYVHHIDILAPLYQCCTLRKSTLNRLIGVAGGVLSEKLKEMPDIENITTDIHLKAMDQRLLIVFATIEYCKKKHNEK